MGGGPRTAIHQASSSVNMWLGRALPSSVHLLCALCVHGGAVQEEVHQVICANRQTDRRTESWRFHCDAVKRRRRVKAAAIQLRPITVPALGLVAAA